MKKPTKIVLSVVGIVLAVFIIFVFVIIYRTFYKSGVVFHGDENGFASFRYSKYKFGEDAEKFFADIDMTNNGASMDFYVFDGDRKTTIGHRYITNYTLDISYDDAEVFNNEIKRIKEKYNYYESEFKIRKFDVYIIDDPSEIGNDNIACFAINPEKNIIRFAIFFDTHKENQPADPFYLFLLIPRNSPVEW